MTRYLQISVCLIAALCANMAFVQVASAQDDAGAVRNADAPAAFVYISSNLSDTQHEINVFAAASNGKLNQVQQLPVSSNIVSMAVISSYLFATDGVYIYSFSIASDGSIKEVFSINAQQFNGGSGGPAALFLDHTGATLYDEDYDGNNGSNTDYQFFDVNHANGELTYMGVTNAASAAFYDSLSFIGNNRYAYGSTCYHFGATLFGFERNSDGNLTELNDNPAMPIAKSGDFYCPSGAAGDPTNHVAVPVQQLNGETWQADGPPQIATYTADSSGNLTTNSTYKNMPPSAVQSFNNVSMAPSGKLVAVAGAGGLQVFHFNGSQPITHFTGLLTHLEISQMFWDNDNHLYAISNNFFAAGGEVFVFTVAPTGFHQAPGSPFVLGTPTSIIVLPKT